MGHAEWIDDSCCSVGETVTIGLAIANRPAVNVIGNLYDPQSLFHCDSPYLVETRTAADVYDCEMTAEERAELLDVLAGIIGKFIVSG